MIMTKPMSLRRTASAKLKSSLLFRFPPTDSPVFGVSHVTWTALAKRMGISETEAIRRAMSDFAQKHHEPSGEELPLPTPRQRRYELSLIGTDGLTGQQRLDQFYSLPRMAKAKDREPREKTQPNAGR